MLLVNRPTAGFGFDQKHKEIDGTSIRPKNFNEFRKMITYC